MRTRNINITVPIPDREDAVRVKRAAEETVRKARRGLANLLSSLAKRIDGEGKENTESDDTSGEVFCAIE